MYRFQVKRTAFAVGAMIAGACSTQAATLYWTGDSSVAFFAEANWSTVANNAALEPAGDPINTTLITDDLVIAGTYNGSPIANAPGGTPLDFSTSMSGISSATFSGNTITLSGTTARWGDNNTINSSPPASNPTFNLDGGAVLGAEAMRYSTLNLADTSQLRVWGTGTAILTDMTINFESTDASILIWNVAVGVTGASDARITNAAGFQFQGAAISTSDLVFTEDVASGGTLVTAVPEPGSLALMGLGGLLIARRRRD